MNLLNPPHQNKLFEERVYNYIISPENKRKNNFFLWVFFSFGRLVKFDPLGGRYSTSPEMVTTFSRELKSLVFFEIWKPFYLKYCIERRFEHIDDLSTYILDSDGNSKLEFNWILYLSTAPPISGF